MKVRMKSTAAGPGVFYLKGSIVDIPDAQAAMFIRGGFAVPVETGEAKAPVEKAVFPDFAETADIAPEETAQKAAHKANKVKKASKKKA